MVDNYTGWHRESFKRWCIRLSTFVILMVIIIQIISVSLSSGSLPSIKHYFKPFIPVLIINSTDLKQNVTDNEILNNKLAEDNYKPIHQFKEYGKKLCPMLPANLIKKVTIDKRALDWGTIQDKYTNLQPGGQYRPKECTARHRMAIVVPYRNREEHLKIFSNHIHSFLQHQQIDYSIYIIEQELPSRFNRAMLMNIGYKEALKDTNYTVNGTLYMRPFECFAFHDVDLLPEDERNMYTCPQSPRHMSSAVDKFNYKLPYSTIFGGVSAFKTADFLTINGFSNMYWGWGGEDDDLQRRVAFHKMTISRYPISIGRYTMIKHTSEHLNKPNPKRMSLLATCTKRFGTDGLVNLVYKVVDKSRRALFTLIKVSITE